MKTHGANVGSVIARLRHDKGLSQKELEKLSGGAINANWLASLEAGRRKSVPDINVLELLAKYLDVNVHDILEQAGVLEYPHELTDDENEVLKNYNLLSPSMKKFAAQSLRELVRSVLNRKK